MKNKITDYQLNIFKDKTIVIVGASSGIGRLAALSFAKKGANIGIIARSADALGNLASEIHQLGARSFSFVADVVNFEAIKRAAAEIAGHFGSIDIWINNAGVAVYAEARETSIEDTRRVMDVNFFGQVHGVLAALPYLEKSGGQIIATLSVDSEIAFPLHSAYVASKHALYGYYKVLHEELLHQKSRVKVSTLLPASIATPFFEHAKTQIGVRPKPLAPVYSPDHVVRAMLKVARNPQFSTVVGGSGRNFIFLFQHFPSLFFLIASRLGYYLQRTKEEKSSLNSNILYYPIPKNSHIFGKDKPSFFANFIESNGRRLFVGLVLAAGFSYFLKRRESGKIPQNLKERIDKKDLEPAA